jgi:hypothetical protein
MEARPPRQINAAIPKELERICLKAVSKRANDRYTTALDLADDLRHFLAGLEEAKRMAHIPIPEPIGGAAPDTDDESIQRGIDPQRLHPRATPKVIPKGLRSFDEEDADFFLDLLPGPTDRDGLPESIRFWKTRIEQFELDKTFRVGLIYGPSGCGKSSLVRAGLLPRLANHIIPIYVESTADQTEKRLLTGLRRHCPSLPENTTPTAALASLRRGHSIPSGKKVLVVLDQFEQWLHAHREDARPELVEALRQCDGQHVQCIVMVRDDFWMAITRFMRDLEMPLLEKVNSNAVDLFPVRHAEDVLTKFGRALGTLPDQQLESAQADFLRQSIEGLAEEGKVVCVRLALFAEMMKGKPWTPAALRSVGGTQGVGVTFLEETFSASTAPPEHRYHQKAARAVLKSLLPESGTDIKGHMRSYSELLMASDYSQRVRDFDDLIRILDHEVRMITPTEESMEHGAGSREQGERSIQEAGRSSLPAPCSALLPAHP